MTKFRNYLTKVGVNFCDFRDVDKKKTSSIDGVGFDIYDTALDKRVNRYIERYCKGITLEWNGYSWDRKGIHYIAYTR